MKSFIFAAIAMASILVLRAHADSSTKADDPVVARGNGFEIRQSALAQVLATAKAQHPQDELPADADVRAINQLIDIQLVLQKATDAEKAGGKAEADARFTNILKTFSAADFERRLKATHMSADDLQRVLYRGRHCSNNADAATGNQGN